jgi:hypothetical protein
MTEPWAAMLILWAVLAVAFVIVWVVRRNHGPVDTGPTTAFIGGAIGLLLSLVIFFALGHRTEAQSAAQAEATAFTTLFSSMAPLPGAISDPPQHAAVCAMRSIINDEWPAMAGGATGGSPTTQQAISRLYGAIERIPRNDPAVQPYIDTIWGTMLERAAARDARLAQGTPQVPLAIWLIMWVGAFIVVVLVGLEERLTGRGAWIGVGAALVVTFTMLVGATAVLDRPYGNVAGVEPDAMRSSLAVAESNQPANSPVTAPCGAARR